MNLMRKDFIRFKKFLNGLALFDSEIMYSQINWRWIEEGFKIGMEWCSEYTTCLLVMVQ